MEEQIYSEMFKRLGMDIKNCLKELQNLFTVEITEEDLEKAFKRFKGELV